MPKIARATLLGAALLVATASVAAAQDENVGYDPTKKLVELVTVTAGPDGVAEADVVLPEDVTEGFEILAEGFGLDDEFRRVVAEIVTDEEAMSVNGETVVIQLASVTRGIDRSLSVRADGFAPDSEVTFFVRYIPPAAPGDDDGGTDDGTGAGGLPRTGSDSTFTVAVGVGLVVLGAGALVARRRRADGTA